MNSASGWIKAQTTVILNMRLRNSYSPPLNVLDMGLSLRIFHLYTLSNLCLFISLLSHLALQHILHPTFSVKCSLKHEDDEVSGLLSGSTLKTSIFALPPSVLADHGELNGSFSRHLNDSPP